MVDLSVPSDGELGGDVFFSDLFAHAQHSKFTGGIRVRAPADMAVFFRGGVPIHAGGAGFTRHHLGEVLVRSGVIAPSQLAESLERQGGAGAERPMLGHVLEGMGVARAEIEKAMVTQVEARLLEVFGAIGSWQSAPGENDRVREMAAPCKTPGLLLIGIRTHGSEQELRALSDALLGKAVQLIGSAPDLPYDENESKVLKYLDKPRKPDQLERAVSRKAVRALLRVLWMHEKLKLVPIAQAIPIAKATKVVAPTTGDPSALAPPTPQTDDVIEIVVPPPKAPSNPAPRRASSTHGKAPSIDPKLLSEVRTLHKEMKNKNYFELLGVKPDTPTADLRKAFTALAKKYHPDAFVGATDEDFAKMIADVSAKLNEAYQTLSNPKSRAEYETLLKDVHIRGDAQKADLIKDAEVKYQKGVVCLRKKDFAAAREFLTQALAGHPESGEYKATLAWATFADAKLDRQEAMTKAHALLTEALAAGNPTAMTLYYMGEVSKARNELELALKYFKSALSINAKFADAEREIRLLNNRLHGKNEGGLLGKLLKR